MAWQHEFIAVRDEVMLCSSSLRGNWKVGVLVRAAVVFFGSVFFCFGQGSELKYKLSAPPGWDGWMISDSALYAINNYASAGDATSRSYIEERIKNGLRVLDITHWFWPYKPGDLAVATGQRDGDARYVRIVSGESQGREGWVSSELMTMTEESKAHETKQERERHRAEDMKRAAAQKEADQAVQKELAILRSLPELTGPGKQVIVATSMDYARDLRNVVDFGKKNGTGIEFRRKMLELISLGCATTFASGTPLADAARNGQFVTFTTYYYGKKAWRC